MKKKLIKILLIELVVISSLFIIISLKTFEDVDSIMDTTNNFTVEKFIPKNNINKEETSLDNKTNNEITKINEEEELINIIKNGLLEGSESFRIDNKLIEGNIDNFFDIVEKTLLNNPEILYYASGRYSNNMFYPKYSKTIKEKQIQQYIINNKRDEIISKIIEVNMSEYEKVKTIHDYIINNTKYDKRHFVDEKIPLESYTVYGVLIEGVAVCEGYAKTMKYLLDGVGIESIVVSGKANEENHAWNIVNIGGNYYHIDATWDDPVIEDGSNILIYDYFNLKDEDMEKTHSWDREQYPRCISDKYNYYNYSGLVIYSYDQFYKRIERALMDSRREIALKIIDFDERIYDVSEVINKIVVNNPNITRVNQYSYSINNVQGIVRIKFYY